MRKSKGTNGDAAHDEGGEGWRSHGGEVGRRQTTGERSAAAHVLRELSILHSVYTQTPD